MTAAAYRASRVDQARQAALPRKPLPVLLILAQVYRDEVDDGPLALGPGVDRTSAITRLRRDLDSADPGDFAGVVARWATENQARWVG